MAAIVPIPAQSSMDMNFTIFIVHCSHKSQVTIGSSVAAIGILVFIMHR